MVILFCRRVNVRGRYITLFVIDARGFLAILDGNGDLGWNNIRLGIMEVLGGEGMSLKRMGVGEGITTANCSYRSIGILPATPPVGGGELSVSMGNWGFAPLMDPTLP